MALTIDGKESPSLEIDGGRRAPRISAEDVFQAADALLMEGHRPTIDRVRMKLGRGSPNTINEHLDTWWTKLGARLRDLPGQVLPGLPEAVVNSLLHLWNLAVRESQQALSTALAEREAALTTRSDALDRRELALQERERAVEARGQAQADALVRAERQLEEANQRARVLEGALQQRGHELDQVRTRVPSLEGELAHVRQQLQAEQQRHAIERERLNERYDALQNRSAQEIDRLHQAQKEDQKRLKEGRGQLERITTERDKARAEVSRLEGEIRATQFLNQELMKRPSDKRGTSPKQTPTRTSRRRRRSPP